MRVVVDGYGVGGLGAKVFVADLVQVFRDIIGAADFQNDAVPRLEKIGRRVHFNVEKVHLAGDEGLGVGMRVHWQPRLRKLRVEGTVGSLEIATG